MTPQKGPKHGQDAVEKELRRLQEEGHVTKVQQNGYNIFVSPAVIAIKSVGSEKSQGLRSS